MKYYKEELRSGLAYSDSSLCVTCRNICVSKVTDVDNSLPAQLAALHAGLRLMRAQADIHSVEDLLQIAFPEE